MSRGTRRQPRPAAAAVAALGSQPHAHRRRGPWRRRGTSLSAEARRRLCSRGGAAGPTRTRRRREPLGTTCGKRGVWTRQPVGLREGMIRHPFVARLGPFPSLVSPPPHPAFFSAPPSQRRAQHAGASGRPAAVVAAVALLARSEAGAIAALMARNCLAPRTPAAVTPRYPACPAELLAREVTFVVTVKDSCSQTPRFARALAVAPAAARLVYAAPSYASCEAAVDPAAAFARWERTTVLRLPPHASPMQGWLDAVPHIATPYALLLRNDAYALDPFFACELLGRCGGARPTAAAATCWRRRCLRERGGRRAAGARHAGQPARRGRRRRRPAVRHDRSLRRALNRGRDLPEGEQADFVEDHGFLIRTDRIAAVVDPSASFTLEYLDMILAVRARLARFVPTARLEFRVADVGWADVPYLAYKRSEVAHGTRDYLAAKWGAAFPNTGFGPTSSTRCSTRASTAAAAAPAAACPRRRRPTARARAARVARAGRPRRQLLPAGGLQPLRRRGLPADPRPPRRRVGARRAGGRAHAGARPPPAARAAPRRADEVCRAASRPRGRGCSRTSTWPSRSRASSCRARLGPRVERACGLVVAHGGRCTCWFSLPPSARRRRPRGASCSRPRPTSCASPRASPPSSTCWPPPRATARTGGRCGRARARARAEPSRSTRAAPAGPAARTPSRPPRGCGSSAAPRPRSRRSRRRWRRRVTRAPPRAAARPPARGTDRAPCGRPLAPAWRATPAPRRGRAAAARRRLGRAPRGSARVGREPAGLTRLVAPKRALACASRRCVGQRAPSKNFTTRAPPGLRHRSATSTCACSSSRCASSRCSWSISSAPSAVTRSALAAPASSTTRSAHAASRRSPAHGSDAAKSPCASGSSSRAGRGAPATSSVAPSHVHPSAATTSPTACTKPPGASQRCTLRATRGRPQLRAISHILW